MSKRMDEQLKLARKVVAVVDRANRKICVTLLRYGLVKPECCYNQVQLLARKEEDELMQQIFYVNYELWGFLYKLDGMVSVIDEIIAKEPICKVV